MHRSVFGLVNWLFYSIIVIVSTETSYFLVNLIEMI